jgi:hypothetical protein
MDWRISRAIASIAQLENLMELSTTGTASRRASSVLPPGITPYKISLLDRPANSALRLRIPVTANFAPGDGRSAGEDGHSPVPGGASPPTGAVSR